MKPKFLKTFLIAWLLMFSKDIYSQKKFSNFLANPKKIDYSGGLTPVRFSLFPQSVSAVMGKGETLIITPDYYVKGLGFVCRNELKLDSKLPVQLRFRLGSLEYVNNLEGKGY